MANLSDDELRRMGKEQLKEAFEENFSKWLTHILEFDPYIFVEVETAKKILQAVNLVAITYGKNYVAEDQYLWVFTQCTGLRGFEVSIGHQRYFIQLLR
ncbi:hypothetical protein M0R45_017441 [Rubus argutus]|uniref:Uncharacterized protein n=1 Tax=Rubus argutus TaxID=59490 RepID=A0AAW1XY03_RUBAR